MLGNMRDATAILEESWQRVGSTNLLLAQALQKRSKEEITVSHEQELLNSVQRIQTSLLELKEIQSENTAARTAMMGDMNAVASDDRKT